MIPLVQLEVGESRKKILKRVFRERETTRGELVKSTGLSNLTITKLVSDLIKKELLIESGSISSSIGRHPTVLKINPEHRYTIGIDIGFYDFKIGVVKFNGEVLESHSILSVRGLVPALTVSFDELCGYILDYLGKYGRDRFLGIGIGISGMVDFTQGKVVFCPNIAGYDNFMLADELGRRVGLPVLVDTSARCMALGEQYFGVGFGIPNQIFLSLGYGTIAAGLVIDGKLFRGVSGYAGEIGHNQVPDHIDVHCSCGSYGCLELTASLSMILINASSQLKQYDGYSPAKLIIKDINKITPAELVESYRMGDKIVTALIEKTAESISGVLSDTVNTINPALVVLGGGLVEHIPEIVTLVERSLKKRCLVPVRQGLEIKKSILGQDVPVIGAAMQIIRTYFNY